MPLYEFECKDCKTIFEELVLHSSMKQTICCPDCSSTNINKLISLFGVAGAEKKVSSSSCTSCSSKSCSTCK